jgi:hypothetical protein
MRARIVTIVLLVGLAYGLVALVPRLQSQRLPGNQLGYEPVQPIAFSHRLHAGELQISCVYCHHGAETSKHAGIPTSSLCMNCHKFVSAPLAVARAEESKTKEENRPPKRAVSSELHKLYEALALDDELQPVPGKSARGVNWVQVHNLPAFACFDHRAHVGAGVSCQHCHGPVETMERVRQVNTLSMGWCVNCHREVTERGVAGKGVRPSTDCSACHY